MAYDYFSDTPFDLNHDGKIDSNEAAYIYDTFFDEDKETREIEDDADLSFEGFEPDDIGSSYTVSQSVENSSYETYKKGIAAKEENHFKNFVITIIVLILLFLFPSAHWIGAGAGGVLLIMKWCKIF